MNKIKWLSMDGYSKQRPRVLTLGEFGHVAASSLQRLWLQIAHRSMEAGLLSGFGTPHCSYAQPHAITMYM